MGIRTGAAFLDRLRGDGRELWTDGERIGDVTTDARFAGGAQTTAELYDLQHDPALTDTLTYVSPTSGDRVGLSFIEPRNAADLAARRGMVKTWHDYTCGMFGRSPDFLNVMLASMASAQDAFASSAGDFAGNVRSYYEYVREGDLAATHALVSPQVDRSRALDQQEKDIAATVVGDNDKGIVIRGARMLATLAAFSDELLVMPAPSYPLPETEEARAHAFGFAIPIATPGLRLIARPSVMHHGAGAPADFPLAARFDDSDCVVIFDDVLVPWERVFIYRDVEVYNRIHSHTHVSIQTSHQFATKDLAKAEFMRDLAMTLAHAANTDRYQHVQGMLAELINTASFVEAALIAAEANTDPGPGGTVIPGRRFLQSVRFMFPPMFRRACEIVQNIGAGGMMMVPSIAMLDSPVSADIERYFQAANADSNMRIRLFRLAVDAAMSSFSGRQQLYERYFAGDPVRAMAAYYESSDKEAPRRRIAELLDGMEKRWG